MDSDAEKRFQELEARITKLEWAANVQPAKSKSDTKPVSVREFIISKHPKNDVQITLAVAYYLEHFEGNQSFDAKDLKIAYGKSKESIPRNINDKINQNVRKGHLAEASQKKDNNKAWYVTNNGEKCVENDFKEE